MNFSRAESGLLFPKADDRVYHDRPEWERFLGNNHARLDYSECNWHNGPISFARHIDKRLTTELWFDLLTMRITSLRIYGPNSPQWTDGRGRGAATVFLSESNRVEDIEFWP